MHYKADPRIPSLGRKATLLELPDWLGGAYLRSRVKPLGVQIDDWFLLVVEPGRLRERAVARALLPAFLPAFLAALLPALLPAPVRPSGDSQLHFLHWRSPHRYAAWKAI